MFSDASTLLGIAGIGVGTILGGKLVQKYDLKMLFYVMMTLASVSSSLKLVENGPVILGGRLLSGFASGVTTFITNKVVNDTIPFEFTQVYGIITNTGFCLGLLLVSLISSVLLPFEDDGVEAL
jgi:MFS family permease